MSQRRASAKPSDSQLSQRNRPLRILYFVDILYGMGGTEKQLFELLRRLDRSKFQPYVVTFRYSPEMLAYARGLGVEVWPARVKRMYGLTGLRQALSLVPRIRREQIDIVSTFHFISDTYGVALAKVAGVPCVISSRRDTGYHSHKRYRWLISALDGFVDRYLAVGREVAEHIRDDYGVAPEKIQIVYNGIDVAATRRVSPKAVEALRRQYHLNGDDFVVGNISHVRPEKGYDVFFEAIRRLGERIPNLKAFAVGDGLPEQREQVWRQADEKGVRDRVIFTGYVKNPAEYIALMDVACLTPTRNEGFSNALLEEMTLGKAIVATDVGANAEAVVDGACGFIIPPNDPGALAEAILRYYRDPGLRARMGRAALERVQQHFQIDKTIAAIQDAYLSLYAEKTAR